MSYGSDKTVESSELHPGTDQLFHIKISGKIGKFDFVYTHNS